MGIRVTKTPKFKKILKTLKATDDVILSVATGFIVGIRKRTQSGRDGNNRTFKKYNKNYSQYRQSKGRTKKVNLTFSGQMLGGIKIKKSGNGAIIYFDGKENDKAFYNHEVLKREFFKLDDQQIKYMYKRLGSFIAKGLK